MDVIKKKADELQDILDEEQVLEKEFKLFSDSEKKYYSMIAEQQKELSRLEDSAADLKRNVILGDAPEADMGGFRLEINKVRELISDTTNLVDECKSQKKIISSKRSDIATRKRLAIKAFWRAVKNHYASELEQVRTAAEGFMLCQELSENNDGIVVWRTGLGELFSHPKGKKRDEILNNLKDEFSFPGISKNIQDAIQD